jgi:magnesium-transporting ATPase (P-type)
MPLFSSSKDDGDDPQRQQGNGENGEQAAPDEHTRLLPNRVDSSRGMLSPDDPSVSPYNLWSIRILRYLTIFFAVVTFVWWIILLVSAFATPPGFHTRGSGFFAFGYATLTLANMVFTLIFFGVPSKALRILAIVMSVGAKAMRFHLTTLTTTNADIKFVVHSFAGHDPHLIC